MQAEVRDSMDNGHSWGELAVRRVVGDIWPSAQIISCEDDRHPVPLALDTSCGIDWLVVCGGIVKGVSVRAQRLDYARKQTFTIRNRRHNNDSWSDSELGKAIKAAESDGIIAAYQLHAYVDVNTGAASNLACWGLAKRAELLRYVYDNKDTLPQKSAADKQRGQMQTFYYVPFIGLPDDVLVGCKLMDDQTDTRDPEPEIADEVVAYMQEHYDDSNSRFDDWPKGGAR